MIRRPLAAAAVLALLAGVTACGRLGMTRTASGDAAERAQLSQVAEPPQRLIAPPPGPHSLLVAALGDSITAGTPQWDPNPAIRATIDPGILDSHNQWEYWAGRRNGRLAFRNCGVEGDRTDQLATRLASCAFGAEVIVIQGGLNDIAQGRTPQEAERNLRAMVRHAKRLEIAVVTVEVLPWNGADRLETQRIRDLNRLIRTIGRAENVPVLLWYRALEDPRAPGRMCAGLTSDGEHPSVAGQEILGALFRVPPLTP